MSLIENQKSARLPIRLSQADLELIDSASAHLNLNRSEFVLEAALERAQNTMLDNNVYELSLKNFLEFEKILSTPAKKNEKLRDFLAAKSPWE